MKIQNIASIRVILTTRSLICIPVCISDMYARYVYLRVYLCVYPICIPAGAGLDVDSVHGDTEEDSVL